MIQKGKSLQYVGTGLFDFGDRDGTGDNARLQHPLGVTYNPVDQLLYVTDTYNSKIKTVNPKTREVKTYAGTGFSGTREGNIEAAQFNEPGGLTIINGKIYITDTNNNLLRVIDMASREVKTVKITNPGKLTGGMKPMNSVKPENIIKLNAVELKQGEGKIKFKFTLPAGFHINPEALPQVVASSDGNVIETVEMEVDTKSPEFQIPVKITNMNGKIQVEVLVYYCDTESSGICKFRDLYFEIPVSVAPNGKDSIDISYVLN